MTSPTVQAPVWATGRRKTSVARVRVIPGEGKIVINDKAVEDFFGGHHRQKASVIAPLKAANKVQNSFNIFIHTSGGGVTGQAEAIRLGIARALVEMDPKLRPVMRKEGFLTRDPRMVERKKYGQPKARRRYQHSKR
ncbi:MAG: 30S ribosomal protein S9 [Elusimicrobiota bacterium]|jgi:small subunit ribosomal protein S9